MKIGPFLIKLRLKCKTWGAKYRLRVKPGSTEHVFRKHWTGHSPTADYFSNRTAPRFFFDVANKAEYSNVFQKRFIEMAVAIPICADKICANRFDLLGSGDTNLGEHINWHRDFKSGFEWPLNHYTEIKIVDLTNAADVKAPWELSRLQFLSTLGRAYWITNDNKYLDKFVSTTSDWLKHNPVDYGVNWTCSMEVAIRAINVIWGMHFFANSGELPESFVRRILYSLYYHALHIERNLEIIDKGANTNHLLSNYLGLFYIGILFPEFDKSKKWLRLGREGLEREMLLQVHKDGADYECSFSYHRLVLEIFLSSFILGKVNQVEFSQSFCERIMKMIEFSAAITSQSGETPAMGDNDDGFIVKLANDNPHDHRALLDIGAQLHNVKLPQNVSLSEERLWYLGLESLHRWPSMVHRKPHIFKDSGVAVIQNERMHLIFNANGISEKAFGGHKHNDLLSISLEIDSVPFLIDPGTACYTSDYQMRNKSRSTAVHNTVRIDHEEQNRFLEKALFFMFKDARPKIDLWTVTDDVVIVSGFHDGYARLGDTIMHRRTLEVSLAEKTIAIWDEVSGDGKGEHFFESNFLTPLDCHKDKKTLEATIAGSFGRSLNLKFDSSSELHLHTFPAEYYPRYGTVKKGTQICCRVRTTLPFRLETRLVYDSTSNLNETPHRIVELQRTK